MLSLAYKIIGGLTKMKTIKRISAALLAIGISVTIVGCDKGSDSSYKESVSVPTADGVLTTTLTRQQTAEKNTQMYLCLRIRAER